MNTMVKLTRWRNSFDGEIILTNTDDEICRMVLLVATSREDSCQEQQLYDGRWGDMDDEFRGELVKSIEALLHQDRLKAKKINNRFVSVAEMKNFTEIYFEKFRAADTLETMTLYDVTIEREMKNLLRRLLLDTRRKCTAAANF